MASRQSEVPALEPSGPLGKMSLPIGMYRRAFSYDDALEDPTPMTPPPSDMGSIPWKPVIPERKYQHLSKVEEGEASVSSPAMTLSSAIDSMDKVPVVKAKATRVIMSSLITKAGSLLALPQPCLAQILAPWILEAEIKIEMQQINGASLDQDPSRSLIQEALPPNPTEEPRSLPQWN
uniref:Putative monooxygenase p33MONOX n=1 Tax=Molossus molossus TaxID=27622 RepID=A0A7J8I892_MOLMO|nr:hypothetical protein HJG59_007259 [Molossus molossus]